MLDNDAEAEATAPAGDTADDTADDTAQYLDAERDIEARLAGEPIDFEANRAISNIYRAASAVRTRAEQGVLSTEGLSWGGFTILWVLWVWGRMTTARLAGECGLAKGTLTGMLNTLERRDLVVRATDPADRRRVLVSLSTEGERVISTVYPEFNRYEVEMVDGLSDAEARELSRLLRIVVTNASRIETPSTETPPTDPASNA